MKRFLLWMIMLLTVSSFFSCKQQSDDNWNVVMTPKTSKQSEGDEQEAGQPSSTGEIGTSNENAGSEPADEKKEEYTITYEDLDLDGVPVIADPGIDVSEPPQTLDEVMEWIGEDGLILAGRAFGEREGHLDANNIVPFTLTQFRIEKVYYGSCDQSVVQIKEPFCLVRKDAEEYIRSNVHYSQLQDGNITLLFLCKSKYRENTYAPVYYEIPLPEDYQAYSEEYMTELLDFYRGEKSAYQNGDKIQTVREDMEFNADGTASPVVIIDDPVNYWPEKELSDEEMLEEMKDHILIQAAAKYRIKIWPIGHKNYSGEISDFSDEGIQKLSNPF